MQSSNDRPGDDVLRVLGRWGAFIVIAVVGLITTFFAAFGAISSRPGIGGDHDELLMAAFAPGLYRTAMVFDALGWLAMGGLVAIAGLALSRGSPILGRVGVACGITAAVGVVGAFLRLGVVGHLGSQYAAAPGVEQAAIVSAYAPISWIIGAHFSAGQLTVGLGFLAVGRAALEASWMPRIIAWLLLLMVATSFGLLIVQVTFDVLLFPVLLIHVAALAVVGLVLAIRWWRDGAVEPTLPSVGPASA